MKVNRTHDIHCHSKLNLVENGIVTLLLKLMIFLQCHHPLVNDAHYFDGSLIIMMHLQLHQTKDDDESLLIV